MDNEDIAKADIKVALQSAHKIKEYVLAKVNIK